MKTITVTVSDSEHKNFAKAAKNSGMLRDAFAKQAILDKVEIILKENKK